MASIESSTRQSAIAWWNYLKSNLKLYYWRNYQKTTFTPSHSPDELTGREIEEIWKNENSFMYTGLTQSEFINNCEKYFGGKSNQKQLIVEIMEEDSKDGLYDTSLQECVSCNEQKQVHSMCLDCCIKLGNQNQTEISDEEIMKEAEHKSKIFKGWTTYETSAWVMGCQWYREQLKKKQ